MMATRLSRISAKSASAAVWIFAGIGSS